MSLFQLYFSKMCFNIDVITEREREREEEKDIEIGERTNKLFFVFQLSAEEGNAIFVFSREGQ